MRQWAESEQASQGVTLTLGDVGSPSVLRRLHLGICDVGLPDIQTDRMCQAQSIAKMLVKLIFFFFRFFFFF